MLDEMHPPLRMDVLKKFNLLIMLVNKSNHSFSGFFLPQMMAAPQKFLLRGYVATDVAMKMTLTERPQSVDELMNIMRDKFKPRLDCDFTLQYEDPDFDGQLSCLLDIQELSEKGTLKVVRSESDASSTGTSDTDILPHVPVAERLQSWPDASPVPAFSYEEEYILGDGDTV